MRRKETRVWIESVCIFRRECFDVNIAFGHRDDSKWKHECDWMTHLLTFHVYTLTVAHLLCSCSDIPFTIRPRITPYYDVHYVMSELLYQTPFTHIQSWKRIHGPNVAPTLIWQWNWPSGFCSVSFQPARDHVRWPSCLRPYEKWIDWGSSVQLQPILDTKTGDERRVYTLMTNDRPIVALFSYNPTSIPKREMNVLCTTLWQTTGSYWLCLVTSQPRHQNGRWTSCVRPYD